MSDPLPMKRCFEIREPLGRAWQNELITLPLGRMKNAVARDADSGVPLPSQPDGTGSLCVLLDLAPGAVRRIRLEPAPREAKPDPLHYTLQSGQDRLILGNGIIRVAVPLSRDLPAGGFADGPLAALSFMGARFVGAGTWGPFPAPGSVETTVHSTGPLFASWTTRYDVAGEERARYDCRLTAGEDFVQVREISKPGPPAAFEFRLSDSDEPAEWVTDGVTGPAVQRGPLAGPPAPKGPAPRDDLLHIDFNSGHFQMSYSWAGLIIPAGPAVGVVEIRGGRWKNPGLNRILVVRRPAGAAFVFRAQGGSRDYAVTCGDPAAYAPAAGASRFATVRRRLSDLPLDKVRHWVTDWPLPASRPRPLLYPPGTAERWEERLKAWPGLAAGLRRLAALPAPSHAGSELAVHLATGDVRIRDRLLAWIGDRLDDALGRLFAGGYQDLIIFDGRNLKVALEAIDVLRWSGGLSVIEEKPLARKIAFLAACFADPDFWPWDAVFRDPASPRGMGPDYAQDVGPSICPPNFTTDYFSSFLLAGLAYPEHPSSPAWVRAGEALFARNLAFGFYPGGGYCESLTYHGHVMILLTQAAVALAAAGRRDFFRHPRFKANFGFVLPLLLPAGRLTEAGQTLAAEPVALNPPGSVGSARLLTNWGNTGSDCSGYRVPQTLAVAAGIYADRDPAYAAQLMTAWRLSPAEFVTHYSGFNLMTLGRPDLPDVPLKARSRLLKGLGAVMRAAVGTPREVFAWIKAGPATHHNCRDEGGFVLHARGAPLIGDFGYSATHGNRIESAYQTWKHACVTFNGKNTSAYLGTERALPPERWISTPETDLLTVYAPVDYVVPEGRSYLDAIRVPRIEHRRHILFIKPDYFIIHDRIPVSGSPSTWWLHALADVVDTKGPDARFRGRFGTDLFVRMLQPAGAVFTSGTYGVQRHIRMDQPGAGDYLVVLAPLAAGEAAPDIDFDPASGRLTIRGKGKRHDLMIDGTGPSSSPPLNPVILPGHRSTRTAKS